MEQVVGIKTVLAGKDTLVAVSAIEGVGDTSVPISIGATTVTPTWDSSKRSIKRPSDSILTDEGTTLERPDLASQIDTYTTRYGRITKKQRAYTARL